MRDWPLGLFVGLILIGLMAAAGGKDEGGRMKDEIPASALVVQTSSLEAAERIR